MALLILFFIAIPGIGKKNITNVDEDSQKLRSLSQHNSGERKHLKNPEGKNPEGKPMTSHVVALRDNVTIPNLHDDDESGGGSLSTKEIVGGNGSTVQLLESHNCCRKYALILLFIYLIFFIYSHSVETGFGKKAFN